MTKIGLDVWTPHGTILGMNRNLVHEHIRETQWQKPCIGRSRLGAQRAQAQWGMQGQRRRALLVTVLMREALTEPAKQLQKAGPTRVGKSLPFPFMPLEACSVQAKLGRV